MVSNGKIKVLKNKYGATAYPTVVKEQYIQGKDQPEKEPYYGKIKKVSRDDDISYLARGHVFFLKDRPNDPNCNKFHPYLVIQSSYLDKIGKIAVLGITSTPSTINLIPIVMKNSIGYIDPHQPYTYKVDEFHSDDTRFIGSIVNSKALEIATNMYGLYLGMDLKKSRDEIIEDYMNYVDDFKERTKDTDIKPYKHKVLQDYNLDTLELKISFSMDPSDTDTVIENDRYNDDDGRDDDIDQDNDEFTTLCNDNKNIDIINDETKKVNILENSDICRKEYIEIDLKSQAILSAVSALENLPNGKAQLPSSVYKMTIDEIKIFMACLKLHKTELTSMIYNCSHGKVGNRKREIIDKYHITFKGE